MHADRGTKLLFAKINLQWIFKLRILLLWLPDLIQGKCLIETKKANNYPLLCPFAIKIQKVIY